ncbi:MAG: hypothetical protein F7B17_05700 [Desulfurococcales archaeon]|nr:hypothetical protein [Desulfurococcales archaeon]
MGLEGEDVVYAQLKYLSKALKRLALASLALQASPILVLAGYETLGLGISIVSWLVWAFQLYGVLLSGEELVKVEQSISPLIYGSAALIASGPLIFIAIVAAPLLGFIGLVIALVTIIAGLVLFAMGVNRVAGLAGEDAMIESILIAASIIIPVLFPLGCYLAGSKIGKGLSPSQP